MNHETMLLLEKQFDTAFAAPDGIQKLRELILTLAMQGKLVPQDPNDQSASELLRAIEVEKQRLVKEGKIKQPKKLSEINLDDIPYELPKGWEFTRLGNAISCMDAGWSPACDEIPAAIDEWGVLKTTSVQPLCFLPNENKALPKKLEPRPDAEVKEGDILITRAGPKNRVGICCVVKLVRPYLMLSDKIIRFRIFGELIFSEFCVLCLYAGYGAVQIESMKSGMADSQMNISQEKLKQVVIPLPPLAEQRRIVAKIDRLMARCDELEKLRSDRNQKLITVHTAAIDRLLTAQDSRDFSTAWDFITQHFGELYSVKATVAELRKTILQLAVMGKLVPQDPTDEPASELLRAIELEKQRLVKEGKIKDQKSLPDIKLEEVPYDLPKGWEWANLQDVLALVTDGDHQAPPKSDAGIPFLVIGNLNTGKVTLNDCRFVPYDYYESLDWGRKPATNDILYTVTGSYGIPIFIDSDLEFCVQRHVAILKSTKSSPVEYLTHLLKSKYAFQYATSVATGIAQKTVPLNGLRKMPIAVPPIKEQHRIVAKIDRLMALCDRLEGAIATAQAKQTDLLNAVMAQV
jgi:type I restriction enzyme, S subunit